MTRTEYNEFRYIRSYEKKMPLNAGTTLTIRTNGSKEFKRALHELYTRWGFHPASVRVDNHFYDDQERIIYIFGLTFEISGNVYPWSELYSFDELNLFEESLN